MIQESRVNADPNLGAIVARQRQFFQTGATRNLQFRLDQLQRLKQGILDRQNDVLEAVRQDLGRPPYEAYFELSAIAEVNLALKGLKRWAKPQRVSVGIDQFPSQAWIEPEPLGVALIIGPWNYPFQLIIGPLIGAIAAGNCAIVKPSEQAPHTAQVLEDLLQSLFEPQYVAVVTGEAQVSQSLLQEKFDHIFFTGGTAIGRRVMAAAAQHLTPVTLELGGKNPCIVEPDIHVDHAAKRILWGKCINAGQTCLAPDYLLVHRDIYDPLIDRLRHWLGEFYGNQGQQTPDYGRIINDRHLQRLTHLLRQGHQGQIIAGGDLEPSQRYLSPTLITGVTWADPIMEEEIFGPILPILTYNSLEDIIPILQTKPKPLALYLFSQDKAKQRLIQDSISSGGLCFNDTVMHIAVQELPFGGVGDSGMGRYHGKTSFDTFSHYRSILKKAFWLDLDWRYPPYSDDRLQQLRRLIMR